MDVFLGVHSGISASEEIHKQHERILGNNRKPLKIVALTAQAESVHAMLEERSKPTVTNPLSLIISKPMSISDAAKLTAFRCE